MPAALKVKAGKVALLVTQGASIGYSAGEVVQLLEVAARRAIARGVAEPYVEPDDTEPPWHPPGRPPGWTPPGKPDDG